jgi:hypothetical protein
MIWRRTFFCHFALSSVRAIVDPRDTVKVAAGWVLEKLIPPVLAEEAALIVE